MNTIERSACRNAGKRSRFYLATIVAQLLLAISIPGYALDQGCSASARYAFIACEYEARSAYHIRRSSCLNSTDPNDEEEDGECEGQANGLLLNGRANCEVARAARKGVCESLNDAAHEPEFGPAVANNFVNPLQIGTTVAVNPFFPLSQGSRWDYSGTVNELDGDLPVSSTITITTTVTNRTKLVNGIRCVVVNEVDRKDGVLIADTDLWLAQDSQGNVWSCGQEAKTYQSFEEDRPLAPELVTNQGSFKAGNGGDKPGIVMPAAPLAGDVVRKALSSANVEDILEVLALDASATAPAASCTTTCLQTLDYSVLTPQQREHKFYAPGIGRVLEVDLVSNSRLELIDYTVN